MTRKHTGVYRPSYSLQYGLSVISRTPTGRVNAVRCRFCVTFGRQQRLDGHVKKTKRSRGDILTWSSKRWRSDTFTQHHRHVHSKKWNEYVNLPDEEKVNFFNVHVPFAETIPAHFQVDNKRVYLINASIIEKVLKAHFISDETEYGYRNSVINLLEPVAGNMFNLTIANLARFEIIVRFVGNGQSFYQAVQSVRAVRDVGNNPNLVGVTETTVRQSAQATIAINLQHMRRIICDARCWAFSIAFDAATNREDSYLDIRLRVCERDGLANVHLLTITLHESHTGLLMFDMISQLLEAVLGSCWRNKLLSVATDGARNMTGRVQGAVTRFQQVCLPGFIRIWCANHQLDLVIQAVVRNVMQDSFRSQLLSVISYLRRQTTLRSKMGSTCPALCQTRWLSLGSSTKWLTRHREEIEEYMMEKNCDLCPTSAWWLTASAFKVYISLVDECAKAMQGKDTLIIEQNELITKLIQDIRDAVKIEGPLSGLNLLSIVGEDSVAYHLSGVDGVYLVRRTAVTQFLEDASFNAADDLANLSLLDAAEVEQNIAQLFLESFMRISELRVQRSESNAALEHQFPGVLPWHLYNMRPRDFFCALKMQKERLLATFQPSTLVAIEEEFRAFKKYISCNASAFAMAKEFEQCAASGGEVFGRAWKPYKCKFKMLFAFSGGLASVFPSTATVESDFLTLQWEKNLHRSSLTDLSLEGILHCKETGTVSKLKH